MKTNHPFAPALLCVSLIVVFSAGNADGTVTSLLDSACAIFTAAGAKIFTRSCQSQLHSCSLGPLLLNAAPGLDVLAYFCNKTEMTKSAAAAATTTTATTTTTTTMAPTTTTPNFTSNLDFYVFDRSALIQLSRACEIKNGLAGVVMQKPCPRREKCGASKFQMNIFGIDSTLSFCTNIASAIKRLIERNVKRLAINKP